MAKKKKKQQRKVIVKKKGGFFGRLLAFLMGIVTGIVGGFGGIAAIVYLVAMNPVQDSYDTIEGSVGDIPGELTDYLDEGLVALPLYEVLMGVGQTVGGLANGANTLQDLANVSPFLAEKLGGVADTLTGYGIPTTKEEFLGLNFANVSDFLMGKLNSVSIAELMINMDVAIDPSNGLLCGLLCGKKDANYYVTKDNKIEFLPLLYTYDSTNDQFSDWDGNLYVKTNDVWILENEETKVQTIISQYQPATVATTLDEEKTITYEYEVTTRKTVDGQAIDAVLYQLAKTEDDETQFNAYANDVLQKHRGLTVGDVMEGEGIMGTVKNMELFSFLNMGDGTSNLMLNLAGYEKNADGKIVVKENSQPVTIGDLMNSETSTKIIDDLEIASLMGVTESSSSLMIAFAYKEGVYGGTPNTIADLKTTDFVDNLEIAKVLNLNASSNAIILALAYGDDYKIEYGENDESADDDRVYTVNEDGSKNYSSKKLSELTGTDNPVNDMKLPTLLGLNESSDTLILKIAYGEGYIENEDGSVTLDATKARTVADLTAGGFIDDLKLGDVIEDCGSSTLLNSMKDWKISELSTKINTLTLGQMITINENSPKILQALSGATLGDGENGISSKVDKLTLSQMITINENSPKILQALSGATLGDGENGISSKVDSLTLGDVIEIDQDDEKTPKILKTLKDATLGGDGNDTLTSKISSLTLNDVMDAESDDLLKHLGTTPIDELPTKIAELTVQVVFADSVYQKAYFDANLNRLYERDEKYYTDEDCTIEYTGEKTQYFIDSKGHALKLNNNDTFSHVDENISCGCTVVTECECADGDECKCSQCVTPELTGAWWYLLTKDGKEVRCSIEEMDSLISNMTDNIQEATLYKLNADGLLQLDDTVLDKTLIGTNLTIGSLTIAQLINTLGESSVAN